MNKKTINIDAYKQQLKSYLLLLAPNTENIELDELINQFEIVEFPKRYILLKSGDFSDNLYFVCKGLIRNYYFKENKEINHWITTENGLLSAAYTLVTGKDNFINYETVEPTIVLKIKYSTLLLYYEKYHSLAHLGRKIVETYYAAFLKKNYEVLFLSAEERYHIFLKDHGNLNNRLPLRIIASFIGITPETLSRLRAKY